MAPTPAMLPARTVSVPLRRSLLKPCPAEAGHFTRLIAPPTAMRFVGRSLSAEHRPTSNPPSRARIALGGGIGPTLRLDVIPDTICPWCYIQKRRVAAVLPPLAAEGLTFEVVSCTLHD